MLALRSRLLRRRLSPITSGSARRRARERQRAEQTRAEGERLARERRHQRFIEKMEQQRLAREQLASYEPWGKAGGGAPNPRGVRYTNLRATGIYPEDELKGITLYEACRPRRWLSPRRRRRTPLRLREDPQICYSEILRKTVDNDIRYRATPDQQKNYKQILDDMVSKRNKALKDEMKRNLDYERKMQTMDGPWGKPGPGGTTWRNPRNIGYNFSNSMGWTNNQMFDKIKGDHKQRKTTALALPQVKSKDEISKEDAKAEEVNNKENVQPSNIEKLPDIKQTSSREGSRKNSGEKKHSEGKDETITNGKQKRSPKKNKFVKRLSNGERLKKIIPDDLEITSKENVEVKNSIQNSNDKKLTPEATILRLTGGIELVPLLARRRRIGARTLPSSDVTRPPEQPCQWREILHADYLRELKRQMQMKYETQKERRQDSAESVLRHHATWASLWGRPGHGAPQQRGKYARSNLAQLLYLAPLTQNAQQTNTQAKSEQTCI